MRLCVLLAMAVLCDGRSSRAAKETRTLLSRRTSARRQRLAVRASLGTGTLGGAAMPDGCMSNRNVPPCFKELLVCAASFFKYQLPQNNWRIDTGTLLGQQRGTNNGWIPWDDDVDITVDTSGMPGKMLDYSWNTKFKNAKGYNKLDPACKNVDRIENTSKLMAYPNMRMIHSTCKHCRGGSPQWLDIDDERCPGGPETICPSNEPTTSPNNVNRTKIKRKWLYPSTECTLDSVKVRCPAYPAQYLSMYYGTTWQTPMYTQYVNGAWVANAPIKKENQDREAASMAVYQKKR